ncbi:MAG: pyrroline-5-carboxylate reductase [Desulfovibrio sp.]|nr:pyrroline-5-carboxylate reductase [Desulfovibrio sp.]
MSLQVGILGCGNMGGALLKGWAGLSDADIVLGASTRTPARFEALDLPSVRYFSEARDLASWADCLVLAIKPYQVRDVLPSLREALGQQTLLCSIAAGLSITTLKGYAGDIPVLRCMPDTPALVGQGVFALAYSDDCDGALKTRMTALFSALGLSFELPEERFAAFSALIGAGPAYVFMVMEAMVQAGVTLGFGHADARAMVNALFLGSACMAKQSTKHLAVLRDEVCSPRGLTIEGVNELERRGVPGALIDAVLSANARGKAMESEG